MDGSGLGCVLGVLDSGCGSGSFGGLGVEGNSLTCARKLCLEMLEW